MERFQSESLQHDSPLLFLEVYCNGALSNGGMGEEYGLESELYLKNNPLPVEVICVN